MKLAELRSAEADFRTGGRGVVAVLPTGAVEQHSRHLPLGTDALIAEMVAAELERQMPDQVVLLPAVWVGASDHHLAMPGTVSVGSLAMADGIARQCLSLAASSGIDRFLILNGHGGNQPACRIALEQIHAGDPGLLCAAVDYWSLMFEVLDGQGRSRPEAMGHADIVETAILLARRPELVHAELAEPDRYRDEFPAAVSVTRGIPERTGHGGVGDPRQATGEMGAVFFDAAVTGCRRLAALLADDRG